MVNREQARLFGWIGSLCLLLIIPVKAIRFVSEEAGRTLLVGIAPSLLGPAGLLFLVLSSSGKVSRLPLIHVALLTAGIALGLECAQLLPRPEILARLFFTFDWVDVGASILSVIVGYCIASWILNKFDSASGRMTGKLHLETLHTIPYVASRSRDHFIRTTQDMLNVLAWGSERGTDLYLFEESNFSPEFYDLSTGLAGEILQKCSNYRIKLAIVGSFTGVTSRRFRDFMSESNRGFQVRFVARQEEAADWLVGSRASP